MYIHLGGEISVKLNEVIGIFNTDDIKSPINKEFIELAKSEGRVYEEGNNNKYKSLVLTTEKVYLSPISSTTLQKRASLIFSKLIMR